MLFLLSGHLLYTDKRVDTVGVRLWESSLYTHNWPTSIETTIGHQRIHQCHLNKDKVYADTLMILKDYSTFGKTLYLYYSDEIYPVICKVYLKKFSKSKFKIIRCLKRVQVIKHKEQQIEIMKDYHQGKQNHRGINETLSKIKNNYFWNDMQKLVTDNK